MKEFPEFIVQTSRWGWNHEGQFRFAYSEAHVRNIVKGLVGRYGSAVQINVFEIVTLSEVTSKFALGTDE